ncbi:MAG: tetratricopeptide repeat protein [Burkholderiales bacterium]|nr:tetratricopeptide repeat protein [Burkholderiales bacterium]
MQPSAEQIAAAIAALEAQRALLGDGVVDTALAPLRRELAALQAASTATSAQQLKQVSVLFVDVVGSTAIGQQLDPETIHLVMDSALERFTAVVRGEGGRVLQYTGDGMLAAFGTEVAAEDDVECAVRAGLGIVEAAREHAPLVRRQYRVPDFNVRVGVHTGRVLLGGGVDAEGSIRGSTVNVAARMEQSAPPGRVRISQASWRHVRGLFEAEEQEPISVKGVAQPVRSWLVVRPLARTQRHGPRGIEGVATPMVGRDTELGLLHGRLQRAIATGRLHAVTEFGEAGLGKSRLLAEFQRGLDPQRVRVLLGRAHPRSAVEPFGVLRDLLLRALGVVDGDAADAARARLEQALAPLFEAEGEAPAHRIGHLLGLDFGSSAHVKPLLGDEARLRAAAFDDATLALRRFSARRPVLLVMDDLHWTDDGTIDFVRHLVHHAADVPLLLLTLTRQTVFERLPDWMHGVPQHGRIDLKPLDDALSQVLAEALLQRLHEVPERLRALLIGGAEGNPFYMEELVKMLIDDGVIAVEADGWRVLADKLEAARVPPTLTGVLQARLDALPPPERLALQQAAIVGHEFWDRALAAIDAAAPARLPLLLKKELVVRRDAADDEGGGAYQFKHHLLHQVTYDGVLRGPKHDGHARVGAFWTARAEVAGPQQVDPAHCRALAEAQYHRCLVDPKGFVPWFDAQFPQYLYAYAAAQLRPLTEQLVVLCEREFGPEAAETARALINLARVAAMQGTVAEVEPLLRRATAIQAKALDADHPDVALAAVTMGGYHSGRGDLAAAEPHYERALRIRERSLGTEHPLTLLAMDQLAKAHVETGKLDQAEALFRRVLAARERDLGPDHSETAWALTALAEVLAKRGDPAAAEPLIRRALEVQRRTLPADHPDTALSMWHLAEALRAQARADEAEPLAREVLRIWEAAFGAEHEWTGWGLICLAEIQLARSVPAEAETLAGRAAAAMQRAYGDDHPQAAAARLLRARALLQAGDAARAEPLLQRAAALGLEEAPALLAAARGQGGGR